MASSIKLYTIGELMDGATVESVTHTASGFSSDDVLDNNPDTFWKGASTAVFSLAIDLGEARIVDALAIWLHNESLVTTPITFNFYHSDNGTDWSTACIATVIYHTDLTGHPIRFSTVTTTATAHRYWRMTTAAVSNVAVEVSGFWCLREHDIGQGSSYPNRTNHTYHNTILKSRGGRRWPIAHNKNKQREMTLKFTTPGVTNFNAILAAYDDSQGDALPLIYRDSDSLTYIGDMVQFTNKSLPELETGHTIYMPTIKLQTLVHADPSENY